MNTTQPTQMCPECPFLPDGGTCTYQVSIENVDTEGEAESDGLFPPSLPSRIAEVAITAVSPDGEQPDPAAARTAFRVLREGRGPDEIMASIQTCSGQKKDWRGRPTGECSVLNLSVINPPRAIRLPFLLDD